MSDNLSPHDAIRLLKLSEAQFEALQKDAMLFAAKISGFLVCMKHARETFEKEYGDGE
jgi:hypothetical protein